MPVLVLEKVDKTDFTKDFEVGEHVIGRGPLLLCDSKKVSRKHGMLRVTETEGVFLHAIHNNPCFYRSCDTNEIRIISFGQNVQLNNDDKIALSFDHGWFKVQIINNSPETVVQNNTDVTGSAYTSNSAKRMIDGDNEEGTDLEGESAAKRIKTNDDNNSANDTTISNNENESTNNEPDREIKIEPAEDSEDHESTTTLNSGGEQIVVKEEQLSEEIDISKLLEVKKEKVDDVCPNADDGGTKAVKEEKEDDCKKASDGKANDNQPSTSGSADKVWKDRCWYGSGCYRKNPAHRAQFRHPGDADYASDPNDTRPICSYGKDCYRKNKEHRKRLRHSGQDTLAKKPPPQKKRRVPKPNPALKGTTTGSDLDDDYDYSDPFLNDGDSSDEYEPLASDTESDYEESSQSQSIDEDVKQLQKDAKKFTRRK